ncbi:glycosyltransferase [Halomonas sp. CSM-2]|uniref:glycosyltransferase n=1 Tax=Halomonas sp. CSM-2 TaxID=1975722 RepID=UPI000A28358D|nr:glycosyltransferase [Halomonas sp. CSM-2]
MSKKGTLLNAWKRAKRSRHPSKTIVKETPKSGSQRLALDIAYYRKRYPDLAGLDDTALEQHWHTHGYREGRYASPSHEAGDAQLAGQAASQSRVQRKKANAGRVDLDFYLTLYPDLKPNGITTQAQADAHFEEHGQAENRFASLSEWADHVNLPSNVIPAGFSLADILKRCSGLGVELEPHRVLNTMLGQDIAMIALADTPEKTQEAYFLLGKHHLATQQRHQGRALLEASLNFAKSAQSLELLGNSYLDDGHFSIALHYYVAAAEISNASKWVAYNHAKCLAKLQRQHEAIIVLANGINHYPNFRQQYDELDRLAEQKWNSLQAELLVWVDAQDRDHLIQETWLFASNLYKAYLPMFDGPAPTAIKRAAVSNNDGIPTLPALGQLNTQRILIVGDFHVPQCERYRINQKIEQLEAVGKQATAIDWMELEKHPNTLALHDVVIFYRVPAVPKVIKAIAQVNATGKLSLYEIDDLLFVPEYPPAIESYGGYVGLETYRGLTRGMALFNAAARLCRQGIASTEPLRERLAPLVQEQRCLLHRNGLDHLNQFRTINKSHKNTIDIFYGSGTQAHNSDFIEQALPAIERVLKEVPQARLVVVGYLRLPKAFRSRFAEQYTQLPAVKSVQGYWSLLEQADINIAVLHDDSINACKSELKWFEAACFGIPSVVSSTANYRDVVHNGKDAFLVSSEQEWYSAIKKLAVSRELREQIGHAAMQRAKDEYSLPVLGGQLAAQLEETATSAQPRKRKVALVNVFFPPQSIGGATRVVADNFSALRKHYSDELDVCVFTADAECRTPHEMTVYQHQGCRVYRATTLWREHMDWHPKDPKMHALFSEFLKLEQPDIIHFHCVQRLTASVVKAARDAKVPYMVTAHDAWWISDFQFLVDHNGKLYPEGHPDPYMPIELPPNIELAESIERRRNLKDLLHSAHKVLTVSNAFANIYRKNGITDIEVIPNGISDDVPWAPKDTTYTANVVCGHIGGMADHKGYYLLKEAVLEAQPANIEFLVVDHSKEEGYEHHTHWGRVPVTFIGRVSQDRVVELYRKMDVLFAPSTWPESFGLVTREAAACGCWVVASNLGGIGEDVVEGKTGHVISPEINQLVSLVGKIDLKYGQYKSSSQNRGKQFSLAQLEKIRGFYK